MIESDDSDTESIIVEPSAPTHQRRRHQRGHAVDSESTDFENNNNRDPYEQQQPEEEEDDEVLLENLVMESLRRGADKSKEGEAKARAKVVEEFKRLRASGQSISREQFQETMDKEIKLYQKQVEETLEENILEDMKKSGAIKFNAPITPALFRKFEQQILVDMDKHLHSDDLEIKKYAQSLVSKKNKPADISKLKSSRQQVLNKQREERIAQLKQKIAKKRIPVSKELQALNHTAKRKQVLAQMHERNRAEKEIEEVMIQADVDESKKADDDWVDAILEKMESGEEEPKTKFGEPVEPDEPMVDLTESRAAKGGLQAEFILGEGYSIECGMVSFTSGNTHGIYEAVTIKKQTGLDTKTKLPKRPVTIVLPIRALKPLYQGVQGIRSAMASMTPLPTMSQLGTKVANSKDGQVDLSHISRVLPKMNFKIDEIVSMKSEKVKWGKAVVDVVSFSRMPKDASKNPFTLQVPATLFNLMEVVVTFLYKQKYEKNEKNEK